MKSLHPPILLVLLAVSGCTGNSSGVSGASSASQGPSQATPSASVAQAPSVAPPVPAAPQAPLGASPKPAPRMSTQLPPVALERPAGPMPAPQATQTILVMGDSLSAAYGLQTKEGWVALLETRLKTSHPQWRVVNASISGETTAGGASRITQALQTHKPSVVIIELGANDGLRGLPITETRKNLNTMIVQSKTGGAKVLLLGMLMPPNFGKPYTDGFKQNYTSLAQEHKISLVPFFLEPIVQDRNLFQADFLHPTAAAQPKLEGHVWGELQKMLD